MLCTCASSPEECNQHGLRTCALKMQFCKHKHRCGVLRSALTQGRADTDATGAFGFGKLPLVLSTEPQIAHCGRLMVADSIQDSPVGTSGQEGLGRCEVQAGRLPRAGEGWFHKRGRKQLACPFSTLGHREKSAVRESVCGCLADTESAWTSDLDSRTRLVLCSQFMVSWWSSQKG